MKPTGQRWSLKNKHQINAFVEFAARQMEIGKPITVQVMKADRTSDQNRMFYGLYRDLAAATGDQTEHEAKQFCKLHYGVPILRADSEDFRETYDKKLKHLDYETKLTLMDFVSITSLFTKDQAERYIQTILSESAKLGYYLPPPE